MCIAKCYTAKKHCERLCALRQQNCGMTAKRGARYDDSDYKNARRRGKSIASFYNSGHNCNTACQCRPAFNTCYSACGGAVYEQ